MMKVAAKASNARKAFFSILLVAVGGIPQAFLEVDSSFEIASKVDASSWGAQQGVGNLQEYCSGGGDEADSLKEGMHVEANWEDYGTMYPGKVTKVHKDGSMDIHYDDGFTEERVSPKDIKVVETKETAKASDPKDDPLCEMQEFVTNIKGHVEKAYSSIKAWVGQKKAEKKSDKTAEIERKAEDRKRIRDADADGAAEDKASIAAAPAAAPVGSPSSADRALDGANKAQVSELEKLKQKFADNNDEIQALEAQFTTNDKQLYPEDYEAPKTVDDLIAEWKARIRKQDARIAELEAKLQQQEAELAAMSAEPVSLADIQALTHKISEKCDGARVKAAVLDTAGKLDPELRHTLDNIFTAEEKLRNKVASLLGLDKSSKSKMHKRTGHGTADAEAAEATDQEMLEAARDVEVELRDVQDSTEELDERVIPHGAKWWRYRYEYSYLEAVMMVIVCILMLIWERFYYCLRSAIYSRTDQDDNDLETRGTMLLRWFEFFAGELMVSLFVFLTVWVLSQAGIWDLLIHILPVHAFHLPTSGLVYRNMALEVCVQLFCAIIFYFILMYAVVYATVMKLHDWEVSASILHVDKEESSEKRDGDPKNREQWDKVMAARWLGGLRTCLDGYQAMRDLWEVNRNELEGQVFDMVVMSPRETGSASLHSIARSSEDVPFWKYLHVAVRQTNDVLFRFGLFVWTAMIVTFVIFCLLHRYARLGCVRIMFCVAILNICFYVYMYYIIWRVQRDLKAEKKAGGIVSASAAFVNERYFCGTLHFFQFLLCYGASRMVCASWMWELHYYQVLYLTILTIALFIFFVCFLAPLFPMFAAALAMPPYMDDDNLQVLSMLYGDAKLLQMHEKGKLSKSELAKERAALRGTHFSLVGKQTNI